MSQVCIHQTHFSSTIIIHMQQLRLMPIMLCAYSQHIYACGTNHQQRSSPKDANRTSYVRFHVRLTLLPK